MSDSTLLIIMISLSEIIKLGRKSSKLTKEELRLAIVDIAEENGAVDDNTLVEFTAYVEKAME